MGELSLSRYKFRPKATQPHDVKFDENVVDKIERGFYYPNVKRKRDFDAVRRLAPSQFMEELRRLHLKV